jgi:hypothetical protein
VKITKSYLKQIIKEEIDAMKAADGPKYPHPDEAKIIERLKQKYVKNDVRILQMPFKNVGKAYKSATINYPEHDIYVLEYAIGNQKFAAYLYVYPDGSFGMDPAAHLGKIS